jgi:signal peptidase I
MLSRFLNSTSAVVRRVSPRRRAVVVLVLVALVAARVVTDQLDSTGSSSGAVRPFSKPERGQVVVVELRHFATCVRQAKTVVVRVVGLPGESVAVRHGTVVVNGKEVALAPYFTTTHARHSDFPAQRIPKDQYLVLGEAGNPGCDSRYFGPFPGYLLRPLAVPRLTRAPAFAQGFQTCSTYGLGELEGLYGATTAAAVASAVSREQPSQQKLAIYRGCLRGLPKHKPGNVRVKTPPFVEQD